MSSPTTTPAGVTRHRRRGRLASMLALVLTTMLLAVTAQPAAAFPAWTTPVNLDPTSPWAYVPVVRMSLDGTRATAIWAEFNIAGTYQVRSASGTVAGADVTWGTPTSIGSADYGMNSLDVQLSSDGSMATAIWKGRNSSYNEIVRSASATISGTTATWSSPTDIAGPGGFFNSPRVSLSADGGVAIASWDVYLGGPDTQTVRSAVATISGSTATWGTETIVSANTGGVYSYESRIAISGDGTKATAVWSRENSGVSKIQSASSTISGTTATWGSITDIASSTFSSNNRYLYNYDLAMSPSGDVAIASWTAYLSVSPYDEYVQSASASISGTSATWSTVTDMTAAGTGSTRPRAAISAGGTVAVMTWTLGLSAPYVVQAVSGTISSGVVTWGSPTTVSTGNSSGSALALSAGGTVAVLVWRNATANAIEGANAAVSGTTATWATPTVISGVGGAGASVATNMFGTNAVAVWERTINGVPTVEASGAPGTVSTAKTFGKVEDKKAIDPHDRNRADVSGTSPAGPKK